MIAVLLKGGLGNQLFQFGAALRLAGGRLETIRFVVANLVGNRGYRLPDVFAAEHLPKLMDEIDALEFKANPARVVEIKDSPEGPFIDQGALSEENYNENIYYILDGYFQCGRNLACVRRHVDTVGGVSALKIGQGRVPEIARVAVHYRLGDYANPDVQKAIGIINMAYIDRIVERYSDGDGSIKIYSDDVAIFNKYSHVKNLQIDCDSQDIDVFYNLMNARILAIPNSSFSLAAAFLSDAVETLVRPTFWTKNTLRDDVSIGFERAVVWISNDFYW